MREVTIELFHIRLDSDCGTRSILQTEWPCRGGLMVKCAASILLLLFVYVNEFVTASVCVCVHDFFFLFGFSLPLPHFIFYHLKCALSFSPMCMDGRSCMHVCEHSHLYVCIAHIQRWYINIGALSFSWGNIDKYIWMSLSSSSSSSSLSSLLLLLLLFSPYVHYGTVCISFRAYTVAVFASVAATTAVADDCMRPRLHNNTHKHALIKNARVLRFNRCVPMLLHWIVVYIFVCLSLSLLLPFCRSISISRALFLCLSFWLYVHLHVFVCAVFLFLAIVLPFFFLSFRLFLYLLHREYKSLFVCY